MDQDYFICRTCFLRYTIDEVSLENIENVRSELEACIPQLTLDVVKDYVICNECTQALFFIVNFKRMCVATEEKIYSYFLHAVSTETSVDIKTVEKWYASYEIQSETETTKVIPTDSDNDNYYEQLQSMNNDEIESSISDSSEIPKRTGLCIKTEEFVDVCKHEFDDFKDLPEDIQMQKEINDLVTHRINDLCIESNYQKFCEIESQFSNYSIDEFYSKGLFKLPECWVQLDRLSDGVIEKYTTRQNNGVKCRQCNLYFTNRTLQMKHYRLMHKRKMRCKKCSYKTRSKALLYLHLKSHSNTVAPKIYNCTKCRYHSIKEDNLFYHLRQHNSKNLKESKVTHDCEICEFSTSTLTKLLEHLKIHNTLRCIECKYETWFRHRMVSHYLQLHYIQSPFSCKLCQQIFTSQTHLINHIIEHMLSIKALHAEHNYSNSKPLPR